jgi:adenylate cyclase
MVESLPTRRLAAVLFADVRGYSRLMGNSDEKTLERLESCREIFREFIAAHNGRLVDTAGDSILAEFPSVVEAVRSGMNIQHRLGEFNADLAAEERMDFRIGINSGEVLVKDNSIYGDAVNVAARVQALATAGRVSVSGAVYNEVKRKLPIAFDDLGEHAVKNIAEPVRVFNLAPANVNIAVNNNSANTDSQPLVPSGKPSIAVLAFDNMSGDQQQDYFSDGITEDIITDLSKVSGLFVIARNSSFRYKGRSVDVRTVATELGVRYVLEGSVRRVADRVRINAQLIDGGDGRHIWADRYDRNIDDIFAVQDDVTKTIVNVLKIRLTGDEVHRVADAGTHNPEAYDCCLKGNAEFLKWTPDALDRAQSHYERAMTLDPEYAEPLARLARVNAFRWTAGLGDRERTLDVALAQARKAVQMTGQLALAHGILGWICAWSGLSEEALTAARQALRLDPNGADPHYWMGFVLSCAGHTVEADVMHAQAMRLDPHFPVHYGWGRAQNYMFMGEYDTAIDMARRYIKQAPAFIGNHAVLGASLALTGHVDEAREVGDQILRLNPNFRVRWREREIAWADPECRERYSRGLAIAFSAKPSSATVE